MFRMVLYTQWKWTRVLLLPAVLAAFTLPLLSIQGASGIEATPWNLAGRLEAQAAFGVFYPLLAAASALTVGLTAWGADHQGGHVYALSLPVPRWHLVLLRLAAGITLLAAIWLGLWLGALLAASQAVVPLGLRAYPNLLTLRFILASLVAFGFFFAISAGTVRVAGIVLSVIGVMVVIQIMLGVAGTGIDLFGPVLNGLFAWPGPLDVFSGRWLLIDV
jgi:hypothetical protein